MVTLGNIFKDREAALRLPVLEVSEKVNECLRAGKDVVVTAPPGAGKSTALPLTILQDMVSSGQKILMLEPRRIAARQIAERMASLLGEPVGETVGYRIRFESKVSSKTRIEVLTEGILTRMLVSDPTLDGVGVVIFDEYHERSLASDLALALTREAQDIVRDDLRIVVMSATIDAQAICDSMEATMIESKGRMFPVEVFHSQTSCAPEEAAQTVSHIIRQVHRDHEGDILAFLPGEGEIRRCQELLGTALGDTTIHPLYGFLSSAEQKAAIAPSAPGERKVVLATPIAETSLTIEGVTLVIDSGFCRKMVFDPQNSLSHLETVRISLDMADQRSGRAGRTAPGICYRLWTSATERTMAATRVPEILDTDLSSMALDIAAWGSSKAEDLKWITPPPAYRLQQANQLLMSLGAVDESGNVTSHGRELSSLPCHPRVSQMLLGAKGSAMKALAADIAAILEEKDPMGQDVGADLTMRVKMLREHRRGGGSARQSKSWNRIARIAEQYRSMVRVQVDDSEVDPYDVGLLVASAYPERIAKAMQDGCGKFLLSSGDTAFIAHEDGMSLHDWIAIASMNQRQGSEGKVFLAAPVDPSALKSSSKEVTNVSWDSRNGVLVARKEWRIGRLVLDSRQISDIPKDKVAEVICEAARKDGLSMLDFSDEVGNLQRRVASVAAWHPELELPDLSTETVLDKAPQWLHPFVVSRNATSRAELKKIDLVQALWSLLSYEQQSRVESLAPSHIQVPTGSKIRVDYRQGADAPVLRVRLQECFGLVDTPRVDGGKRPVLMELLSPGFKPVQLTQDLRSFWEGTYFEVRKELRRRYPKHSWPEDPLEAPAVRGVKR